MTRLQIIRTPHFLKWVSLLCADSTFMSSNSNFYVNGSHHIVQKTRFYGTRSCADVINGLIFCGNERKARAVREAESALAEYFHFTRNLQFMDAENMSRNSPEFFSRLMKRVVIDDNTIIYDDTINRAVKRYLRYHPVNEFEPFFESIGLKYSEYVQFLQKDLMFLVDDELLLENYYFLCNYGIERNRIGKIFKEANEVFRYDCGALQAKLQSFENLGFTQSLVAKIVASSPHLLNGNVDEFVDFFEKLKKVGIEHDWLLEHLREEDSYNWKNMLQLMCLLCQSGWSEKQVGDLFKQHPDLLLGCSGRISFGLIGILLKFGSTMSDVQSFLLQFPQKPISKFIYNFHNSYNFLDEIGMAAQDIGRIVRSYPILLGSIELKKVKSILCRSWCGKKRLCQMVKDNPFILEGWVHGRKVEPLDKPKRTVIVMALKTQFLISLGFEETSKDMEKALKAIRGKGDKLQQRFGCMVKNGLSPEEVLKMVKISPEILNQSSLIIEAKIRFFFDDLGYGVSDLLAHPRILCHTIKTLKLRFLTYKWLRDQGALRHNLSFNALLCGSDEEFIKSYVNSHLLKGNAGGFFEFLEKLKKVEIEYAWLLEHMRGEDSYNWKSMIHLMFFLCKSGLSEKQVGELFKQHPDLLLEYSGRSSFGLIGILLKSGSTISDVQTFFLQFPRIPVSKFSYNLYNSYNFLVEIGMPAQDIGRIVRSYPILLGSIVLKKVKCILDLSWCGKKRLCQMVKDDPYTLEQCVRGRKLDRLYTSESGDVVMGLKTQFLINLGFEESSNNMEKALKRIRGKGEELQQRFDCLVKNGLSHEEAMKMIKISPEILSQNSDVIEAKIHFFFDDLGYGVSELVKHPRILCRSIKRLKLRFLMFKWLKDQGAVSPNLSFNVLLSGSDEEFIRNYVNPHARGPDFWKSLEQKTYLDHQ